MITKHDLDAAIAECQGRRNPDANTCIKLAAYYTIKREMYGEEPEMYSYSPAPDGIIHMDSESEFARLVYGREQRDVFPVMDELMEALAIIQPRLYDAVLVKLS